MAVRCGDLRGRRAANNWLRNVAPSKLARKQKHHKESVQRLEIALGGDAMLIDVLHAIMGDARWFGQVWGAQKHRHGASGTGAGTERGNRDRPASVSHVRLPLVGFEVIIVGRL